MNIRGKFVVIGELSAEDVPAGGVPAIQIKTADGRVVTVTGLSREECRSAGSLFMEQVTLSLDAA